ncbi:hypothetical protein MMC07_001937 [Pseudocyphellaria aurata]|nr:hypothetical protein [Pseudocyphellaria aurata]
MQRLVRKYNLINHHVWCKVSIGPHVFPNTQRCISFSSVYKPGTTRTIIKYFAFSAAFAFSITYVSLAILEKRKPPLNPQTFTSFTLVEKEAASSTSSIFHLEPTLPGECSEIYSDAWKEGVWSVQMKQPQLQIARSYTPLPPVPAADESGRLRFLIRWEPRGEVSTYLHKLRLGATVELRGPHIEFTIPDDVEEVLFIAGGTGIAPALQVAYNLFEKLELTGSIPKLHILWANRRREDSLGGNNDTPSTSSYNSKHWSNFFYSRGLPITSQGYPKPSQSALVQELEALKQRKKGNVTVDYFCDEENSYITQKVLKRYLAEPGISTAGTMQNTSKRKKLILISGPEGFVNYHAGPKTWSGGQELQGSLGGILKALDPNDWMIWKL